MNAGADSILSHSVQVKLSYKFQRLREQIRHAILHGELEGQLPGERELGRRFRANAKTINKALCDLAGDGLVKRYIGRGTFVSYAPANHVVPPQSRVVHWLAGSSTDARASEIKTRLLSVLGDRGDRLESDVSRAASDGRLDVEAGFFRADRQVDALVIATASPLSRPSDDRPGDALLLSLARRQIPTILLGSVCDTMKRHAVLPDYVAAGFRMSEYLFDLGCHEVAAAVVAEDGSEIRAVLHGHATSCRRRHRPHRVVTIGTADESEKLHGANGLPADDAAVLCVGGAALERISATVRDRRRAPRIAAVLEPGDDVGQRLDVATYEFDSRRLVDWAARLILECGRGTPPIEVLVPGSIHIRSAHPASIERDSLAEAVV